MNKLLMIYGCVLLCSPAVANEQQSTVDPVERTTLENTSTFENEITALTINAEETGNPFELMNEGLYELNLNEIVFIEEDSELDLGFDTSDYLPKGFNPHETYFDLNSIIYVENEVELDPGFDGPCW